MLAVKRGKGKGRVRHAGWVTYGNETQGEVKDGNHSEDNDVVVELFGLGSLADGSGREELLCINLWSAPGSLIRRVIWWVMWKGIDVAYPLPQPLDVLFQTIDPFQQRAPECLLITHESFQGLAEGFLAFL